MPRPKKPQTPIDAHVVNDAAVARSHEASRELASIDSAASDIAMQHLLTAQMVGGIASLRAVAHLVEGAAIELFKRIRDEKRYVDFPYRDEHGATRVCRTLEEFCPPVFGLGYDRMRQLEDQYDFLGASAFKSAQQLQISFRQQRAIQEHADADTQARFISAVERGDKGEAAEIFTDVMRAKRAAEQESEARGRVIEQKSKKLLQIEESEARVPAWQRTFDKATKATSDLHGEFQVLAKRLADHAAALAEVEFDGVEKRVEVNTLRAQLANHFYDAWQSILEQSMGLAAGAVAEHVEPVLELARKQLPDDVRAKIFGDAK